MPTIEITATFYNERFRFANDGGDVVIGDVEHVDGQQPTQVAMYAVKGADDPSRPLAAHRTYRFYGRWTTYKNKRTGETEPQFHFDTYVEAEPASRAGVIAYIKEAGKGRGIGPVMAKQIWDRFGADSVKVLRENPEVVAAGIPRLSLESARLVASVLAERARIEHCSIELMGLLDRRGFPKQTASRAIAIWGNQAADLIKRNPYLLMRFRGCGFKGTDKMYLELGLPVDKLKRQALCAWYAIASDTTGHTWYPRQVAYRGIEESMIGRSARMRSEAAVRLAIRSAMLSDTTDSSGRVFLAESKAARNERFIARHVVDAEEEPVSWPDVSDLAEISDHQRERLSQSLRGPITVFGGGPGTGKTFTAAALIRAVCQQGSSLVSVAAPTGKAAVRITEAMASYGVHVRAKTIHSLLGVETSENGWSFRHNEANPLECRYLIVDEASMIDTDLMSSLLAARGQGTHVLFVGDIGQLPPVGHGAPLRDLIRAQLPYGELVEIKRNDGGIVQACADIRAGKRFRCAGNLVHRDASTPDAQITECLAVCQHARTLNLSPIWDTQIVVPVNAKSPVSRRALNGILQRELNQNPGVSGTPFRTGDKIVCSQNGFYPAIDLDDSDEDLQTNDRDDVYVANGELAEVLEASEKLTIAKLDNPRRTIKIPRGKESGSDSDADQDGSKPTTGCAFDLAYALSVHKSQGSEWPIVAVVLDKYPGARMVMSREFIYTAISRARFECHLVGDVEVAYQSCRRQQLGERKTFLVEEVARERAARVLADL